MTVSDYAKVRYVQQVQRMLKLFYHVESEKQSYQIMLALIVNRFLWTLTISATTSHYIPHLDRKHLSKEPAIFPTRI
jgi:hypothetical protein